MVEFVYLEIMHIKESLCCTAMNVRILPASTLLHDFALLKILLLKLWAANFCQSTDTSIFTGLRNVKKTRYHMHIKFKTEEYFRFSCLRVTILILHVLCL
jgi:hypothetical protein